MSEDRQVWPKDWSFQSLEKIASHITSGGTPTSGSPRYYLEYGGIPFAKTEDLTRARSRFIEECDLGISEAALKETAAKKYPVGTVLISMYGTIGLTKIAAIEMAANQALCALIPPLACDSGYLYHHLEYTRPGWLKYSGQTTQANINGSTVRSHQVPLPDPIEQRKIAQVLDALDTAIHETEAIIAKLKSVKQGLLHGLLTRGIDANGELRPPQSEAPHLYKQSALGWIPKEWEVESIFKLTTDSVIGPFGSDLVAADYRVSGVPVIFVRDIKPDCLTWKSNVYVNARKAQALAAHEVIAGDVVATKMGFPPCIAAVYPTSMPNGIVTADIVRLRPDINRIYPHWMSTFINAPVVAKQVEQITAGVTRPKVTLRDVRNLIIATPSMEEQHRVLDRVAAIELRIELEVLELQKLVAKKFGLMDDLLTGRVRVTPLLEGSSQ
jgi:type I restriction enzyme, S subunit